MKTIIPGEVPVRMMHKYLLGAVAPRPIALASTVSAAGIHNIAPFSFFNVFSANPPIAVFSPARSGRTGELKDTLLNIREVPECVINIVNYDIVAQTSLASSPYPPEIDEFEKAGFTPLDSETVKPKRVKESPIHLECKVNDVVELGQEGAAGNLVIAEITRMHIHENLLDAEGLIDQTKADFAARMGGNWYARATPESMFEIDKPLTTCGIGFDGLPVDIRTSEHLSLNEKALLANVETLPDETEVNEYKLTELSDLFVELHDNASELEHKVYALAKDKIAAHQVGDAWKALLALNI